MMLNSIFAMLLSLHCHADEIKLWAGKSVTSGRLAGAFKEFEAKTGTKIIIPGDVDRPNNSVWMFESVAKGEVEASIISVPFEEWKSTAIKGGVSAELAQPITQRVVGHDIIEVMSHKDVGVDTLSEPQLTEIFTGSKRNWKDFGGKDQSISLVILKRPGANAFWKTRVNKGKEFSASTIEVDNSGELIDKLSSTPGAIAFGPAGSATSKVKTIKTPMIGKPTTLITKGKPSAKVQALIDFMTNYKGK